MISAAFFWQPISLTSLRPQNRFGLQGHCRPRIADDLDLAPLSPVRRLSWQTFYGHTNAVNHVCCSLKGDMVSCETYRFDTGYLLSSWEYRQSKTCIPTHHLNGQVAAPVSNGRLELSDFPGPSARKMYLYDITNQ